MQITICGGGNAAHTLAGLLSANKSLQVFVYLSFQEEADRWNEGFSESGGILVRTSSGVVLGRPQRVSADPSDSVPGSSLVIFALPAFAHEAVLRQIAPHLDQDVSLGALPARGCFDLCVQDVLDGGYSVRAIFGLQTLPWACRIQRYGQEVNILGTKLQVDLAAWPREQAGPLASSLGSLLSLAVRPVSNFLSLTLAGTGQLIHPGVMYGLFRDWDGRPFEQPPLFYQGVDVHTASILQSMSDEVQRVRAALLERFQHLDLSAVTPLGDWLVSSYAGDIADISSLQTSLVTNRSYAGLKAPVLKVEGGFVPDYHARYLAEDVPYGLIATRGIAGLAGVPTPTIDQVIRWAQGCLGKEYLTDGDLRGVDLESSRAPQRFGYTTIDQLVERESELV